MNDAKNCTLRLAAHDVLEPCPQGLCAFWETGRRAGGSCVVDRLGVDVRRPEVAAYLLEMRERLEWMRRIDTRNGEARGNQ